MFHVKHSDVLFFDDLSNMSCHTEWETTLTKRISSDRAVTLAVRCKSSRILMAQPA